VKWKEIRLNKKKKRDRKKKANETEIFIAIRIRNGTAINSSVICFALARHSISLFHLSPLPLLHCSYQPHNTTTTQPLCINITSATAPSTFTSSTIHPPLCPNRTFAVSSASSYPFPAWQPQTSALRQPNTTQRWIYSPTFSLPCAPHDHTPLPATRLLLRASVGPMVFVALVD